MSSEIITNCYNMTGFRAAYQVAALLQQEEGPAKLKTPDQRERRWDAQDGANLMHRTLHFAVSTIATTAALATFPASAVVINVANTVLHIGLGLKDKSNFAIAGHSLGACCIDALFVLALVSQIALPILSSLVKVPNWGAKIPLLGTAWGAIKFPSLSMGLWTESPLLTSSTTAFAIGCFMTTYVKTKGFTEFLSN